MLTKIGFTLLSCVVVLFIFSINSFPDEHVCAECYETQFQQFKKGKHNFGWKMMNAIRDIVSPKRKRQTQELASRLCTEEGYGQSHPGIRAVDFL